MGDDRPIDDRRGEARAVTAIALACVLAACSLIGVHIPDEPPPGTTLDCDPAIALAAIDTIAAAAGVAVGIYFNRAYANSECCRAVQAFGTPPLVGGVVYALSAFYGFGSYGRCRRNHGPVLHP